MVRNLLEFRSAERDGHDEIVEQAGHAPWIDQPDHCTTSVLRTAS